MKTRFSILLSILLIAIGSLSLALPYLRASQVQAEEATRVAVVDTSVAIAQDEPLISGQPTHIVFPEHDISVDVVPGYYYKKTNSWTLSDDKAHFATVTSEPNNKTGNTFIYAHNRKHLFQPLSDAAVGNTAVVTTDNGHTFTYKMSSVRDVGPYTSSYLATHNSPILTVQTCSGIWDETRRMFTFDLVEAQ